MSTVAEGNSAPSRKRTKWDEEDHENEAIRRRQQALSRQLRSLRKPRMTDVTSVPKGTSLSRSPIRDAYSIFVPPRAHHPPIQPSRSVYCYERLNQIEEGSYGVVFRARDKETGDIVALKKLKLEEEKHGFPITALREINALMSCRHENVVHIREVVVGDTLTQVFVVMDFIEHDLKTLLTLMPAPFLQSEIKTLMLQLLSAVAHCHANWILHRDLKTSNLLMNNRGTIKVADFGLARRYGDPIGVGGLTQLVVTLWYRAPEILLGATNYSTAVDMWSVGCIFAELLLKEPLFQAKGEIELLSMIFKLLGPPTTLGLDLLTSLLTYDPQQRISAEEALHHPYFSESPLPKHPDLFASFPSAAAGEKRKKPFDSPSAPLRAADRIFAETELP
ncbi:Pkinase-domain-containing protein [Pisolithus orientalis]|uniref:Pkinase-domain-containing protein n=1 Tax=Pisolithus orientalis TaxID=936130 RepID=UPI00222489CF|nr:Pkinase-domain-containing protein [Pisolithus orientalis]KAI6005237.1 Pkinase-domain-containing protein [Pisolithus orientalis]